ncbi:IS3 family transposase [Escherichia albertii]|nr:IS3 family transposase [Escherichia albertii]MCZ8866956.1 IS3 family transposase [Escherichia albertii]
MRPKYSLEFRLSVVKYYFEGHGDRNTSSKFGVNRDTVRHWTASYEQHGIDGITWKNDRHSPEFKLSVVQMMLKEQLSTREVTARFNISDRSVVQRWLRIYNTLGAEGLLKRKQGRSKSLNKDTKPQKAQEELEKSPEELSPEELRDELRYLRAENAYLKKLEALGSKQKAKEKTQIINELRHEHSLRDLLRAAKLPRSTWYHNLNRLTLPDPYADLKSQISEVYQYHKGRYGYRRITIWLRRQGLRINHKVVQKLMGELDLRALIRVKKYRSWKGDVGKVAPNLLQRNFDAEKANEKWVTDVTEFAIDGKKLYLSPVLDLYNREIIAYSISERPRMQMINSMLEQAMSRLRERDKPVLHSDQGWQYQMKNYQNVLQSNGVVQSMSRKGNCLDNAVMESFFGILKSECYYLNKFKSTKELRRAIEEYIDYYNHERISSRLEGLSPVEYRTQVQLAA